MNGLRRDCDKITIGHVHDNRKDFLAWNMKPSYIRDVYTSKIMMLGEKGNYASKEFMGGGDEDTKSVLVNLTQDQGATIMVCGMHGRKGPKADPTIAGTAVNFLARNCPNPLIIIKDPLTRADKKSGWYRFGVCYDGSNKAIAVLETTLGLMKHEDRLTIITCKESNIQMGQIESTCNTIAAKYGMTNVEYVAVEREAGQNVYKAIQHYLIMESNKDNYVDFVAVGNTGVNYMKNKGTTLGSVSNMVVRAKRMNVIF